MAQFGRPDSDVSTGSWTATPLWSKIDEVTADAGDLVTSSNDPSSDAFEVHTENVTDPADSTSHFVRVEHRMRYSGGGSPGAGTVQVELYQGTTQIATATHNYAANMQDVLNTTTISLTGGEADSITNYSDLRIRVTANKTSGARTTSFEVTWAEIEVPDAFTTLTQTARIDLLTVHAPTLTPELEWGAKTTLTTTAQTQWGPYRSDGGDYYLFGISTTTLQAYKAAFIDGDRTLDLDGTEDYASAPDTGWTVGGGDLDLRANLVTDWQTLAGGNASLVSKRDSVSTSNQSFIWLVQTNETLRVNWNETGGTERIATSSTGITAADGDRLSVRVTVDVDNGGGQYEVKFYTSPDADLENATWTQLGTTVTGTSGVSSVRDTTSDLMAGAYLSGVANPVAELDGQIYSVRVFDGGTLVEGFDANDTSIGGGTIPGLGTSASTWTLQNNAAIISGAYGTIGGTQTTGLGNDGAHNEIQGAWSYEHGEMHWVVIDRYSGGSSGWLCDTHGIRWLPGTDSWSTAAIETGYEVTISSDFGIDVAYDEAPGAAYFHTIGPSEFVSPTWWRRVNAARWNGSSWDWFNSGKLGPSFLSIAAPQGSFSGATRVYAMSGGSSTNDLWALDNSTRSDTSEGTQQQHLEEGPGAAFDGSTFGADSESPGEVIQRTEGDPAGAPSSKTPTGWGSTEFPSGWTIMVYGDRLYAVAYNATDDDISYSILDSAAGTWLPGIDIDTSETTFDSARLLVVDDDDDGAPDKLWLIYDDGTNTVYREWSGDVQYLVPTAVISGTTVYEPTEITGDGDTTIGPPALIPLLTVYEPTSLTTGPITIGPPALISLLTIHEPTGITTGPITIGPPALIDLLTVHEPTSLSVGPITIGPPALIDLLTVFAPVLAEDKTLGPPALLPNTITVFAPTLTPGPVTLSPALLSNTITVFAPTLTVGPITIGPPALISNTTVYEPTLSNGVTTLDPALLSNTITVFAPTLSVGPVTLTPASEVDNTIVIFAPTLSTGPITIGSPALLNNAIIVHEPSMFMTLGPPALISGTTVYEPTLAGGATTLTQTARVELLTVHEPVDITINLEVLVAPLIVSTLTVYAPALSVGPTTITAPLGNSPATVYAPMVFPGGVILTAPLITSTLQVFEPTGFTIGPITIGPPALIGPISQVFSGIVSDGSGPAGGNETMTEAFLEYAYHERAPS